MPPQSFRGFRRHKVRKPPTSQKVDINFPPGRPTADNIESLCHNQRPLYAVKCLPRALLVRQAKTINRLEKGFKQCCKMKRQVLDCADEKWREQINRFCLGENGEQVDFSCCSAGLEANDRYSCFQNISPDPHYNKTSATSEEHSLDMMCDTSQVISSRSLFGLAHRVAAQHCCRLSDQEKTKCLVKVMNIVVQRLCLSRRVPPSLRHCCRTSQAQCTSIILKSVFSKGTSVGRQKKKKRCPLA